MAQLRKMGLIAEYLKHKSAYDKCGHRVFQALVAAGIPRPLPDDIKEPFAQELLSYRGFLTFMSSSFSHMPTDDYVVWARKLVTYILENCFNDISQP